MIGADKSDLGVKGAVVVDLSCQDKSGATRTSKELFYVCDRLDKVFLSYTGLQTLWSVSSQFPLPASPTGISTADIEESSPGAAACGCPARPQVPPPCPTELPAGVPRTAKPLKRWLLEHYASTVFNQCDHQPLPRMTGAPLRLHVDEDARPVACHKVIPVPLHWREKVKADLERDVRLGVLKKVPENTPVTWLSRMVVTAKSNGEPRRTVDFQALNKHSTQQTFPIESPFHSASCVPTGKKKTVVDVSNGYHCVPLHPDSQPLTTFLAPWGRFCYLVSPQGHMTSGDGFNERYDSK